MEKNEVYTAVCSGYNDDGAGVVKIDGIVIFVPGLLDGEEAEIGITAMKRHYGYGRIVKLLKPSVHRVKPICQVDRLCGGCQLLHMDRQEQNTFKEEKLKQCFRANANMEITPLPIITAAPYYNYRNKVQIPVQVNNGHTEMGFYRKHTNTIIPFEECHAESALSNEIVRDLRKWFDEFHCADGMRHVLIKHAHVTGQVMIVFIVKDWPCRHAEELVERIVKKYPQVKSISALINKRHDNVILDGKDVHLYGEKYIEEELLGKRFRISARSFYQINPFTTPLLYSTAIDYCNLTGKEVLVDLYCGTGTMGLIASDRAKKVYGIEIVPDAIVDARKNAQINGVENIEFLTADANQGAQRIIRSKLSVDAMIVDPPRRGCTRDTLDAIVKISPKTLVYVSCDPATLARDVKILMENGYTPEKIQPVDMFPGTVHVETIVLLSKLKTKKHINIELRTDEFDLTASESKATYAKIKQYVLEKHGLKVSSLNIAQIKQKCGIKERDNYNLSKKENVKQPQCTVEKEKAIMDAFRHFQMI